MSFKVTPLRVLLALSGCLPLLVPIGLIFVRFGFEATVASHFFIDFVRFVAAYLVFG